MISLICALLSGYYFGIDHTFPAVAFFIFAVVTAD